jgi:hypothetical protein
LLPDLIRKRDEHARLARAGVTDHKKTTALDCGL